MPVPLTIQAFSDYVCPFCYLGEAALREAAAATGVVIVHRAFQLHPPGAPWLDPLGEELTRAWHETILPMAAKRGLKIHQPSRLPATRLAHEAAAWARTKSAFELFHQALFAAYFTEDKDLGELDVLKDVAFKLGLNPDDLAAALKIGAMAEEIDDDRIIAQTYGVTSVPNYVIGGHLLKGVQETASLVRAIEAVRSGAADEELRRLPHPPISLTRR